MADPFALLAHPGLRIGEFPGAADLRWSDLDFERGMITLPDNRHSGRVKNTNGLRTTKSGRSRRVPIHPDLRTVLAVLERSADGRVLHGPRGGKLKPDTARRAFVSEIIEPLRDRFPTPEGETGFEGARFHSFRHFFVSQTFLGGAFEGETSGGRLGRPHRQPHHRTLPPPQRRRRQAEDAAD